MTGGLRNLTLAKLAPAAREDSNCPRFAVRPSNPLKADVPIVQQTLDCYCKLGIPVHHAEDYASLPRAQGAGRRFPGDGRGAVKYDGVSHGYATEELPLALCWPTFHASSERDV
ncbi:hypothetical protein CMUS01_03322 [Colletotrichum musicola]|uniref:Uncharacterized protein n=1 Tax=Colletotrichum musicola TaxID=2175873 RepID=A0A8H6NT85_9PEZI|nr:hypothetical protein CMUS01_03322 [Colletotrichum musicola]